MWVFINGQLALDLGGIHATVIGNFSLDAIASGQGLVPGASSTIDVFYCERQAVGSDIKITTNIITRPPGPQLVPVSSFTTDTLPVFSWHPLPNQAPYTIQIDTTSSFTTPMITVAVSDTFFKPLVNLPFDTIYWRVKGDSTAFSTGSFIIYLDTVPELVRFNGATISESRPVFTWHPVVNALYYDFDIADNASFTNKTSAVGCGYLVYASCKSD